MYRSLYNKLLVKFCPECGGSLGFDSVTKNFICRSCGLFAPREKFEELHEKINAREQNNKSEDYLDWWQSSKKEKKSNF
ncbi:hypothetical protein YTPLAS21_15310 [Candidatus Nitrosocosmicus sp.]|nr:hypothetical protein YTPLAS21_15310 [Candidatus Nitrosocosmicus sp.]